jgi:hypothetical protein
MRQTRADAQRRPSQRFRLRALSPLLFEGSLNGAILQAMAEEFPIPSLPWGSVLAMDRQTR